MSWGSSRLESLAHSNTGGRNAPRSGSAPMTSKWSGSPMTTSAAPASAARFFRTSSRCASPTSAPTLAALVGLAQRDDVRKNLAALAGAAEVVIGDPDHFDVIGADPERGAFLPPVLLWAKDSSRDEPHDIEVFGPVSTVMGYRDTEHAIELAARGRGSLVGSLVSADPQVVRELVLGVAPWHGRVLVLDQDSAAESTGHGAALPHLVHGGPGRAGDGEELGGIRGVLHYMQRTAVQGSPAAVSAVTGTWVTGAPRK